jgi:mRNA interferase HicA
VSDNVTGREFIRRVRRLARKRGLRVVLDVSAGKGDHATLYLDGRKTLIPGMTGDLRPGTFRTMCRNLGIFPRDL